MVTGDTVQRLIKYNLHNGENDTVIGKWKTALQENIQKQVEALFTLFLKLNVFQRFKSFGATYFRAALSL